VIAQEIISQNQEYSTNETDKEWEKSYSGILLNRLRTIGDRSGQKVDITNKMAMTETFSVGGEKADLTRQLKGGGVGDTGGVFENTIEAYDYRKYTWWREAFDQGGLEYRMVELALIDLAEDAGVEDSGIFRPSVVLPKYRFELGEKSVEDLTSWIREQTVEVLSPLLLPDYVLKRTDFALRLIPLTEEAREARTSNNNAWVRALGAIREASVQLDKIFQAQATSTRLALGSEQPTISDLLPQDTTPTQLKDNNPNW